MKPYRWMIEEKLKLQRKCPNCRRVLKDEDIMFEKQANARCVHCKSDITQYIYFRLNVKYNGIKGTAWWSEK